MPHNPFTEHPASVGETWSQHALFALSCAALLAWALFTAMTHALFPFLFKTTTHGTVNRLVILFEERD